MMNYLLVMALFAFSMQMFSFSSNVGKSKRIIAGLDHSVIAQGVMAETYYESHRIPPFFHEESLDKVIGFYIQENLHNDGISMKYSLFLSKPIDSYEDGSPLMTADSYYQKADVLFDVSFSFYRYSERKTFVIKRK